MVTRILLPSSVPSSLFLLPPIARSKASVTRWPVLCDNYDTEESVKPFTPLFRLTAHRDSLNGTPTSALPTRGRCGSGYRQGLHAPQVMWVQNRKEQSISLLLIFYWKQIFFIWYILIMLPSSKASQSSPLTLVCTLLALIRTQPILSWEREKLWQKHNPHKYGDGSGNLSGQLQTPITSWHYLREGRISSVSEAVLFMECRLTSNSHHVPWLAFQMTPGVTTPGLYIDSFPLKLDYFKEKCF